MSSGDVPKPPAKNTKRQRVAASRSTQTAKQAKESEELDKLKAALESGETEVSVVVQSSQHIRSGPLPPPSELREYDDIMPGLADRLMSGWEGEMVHRRSTQKRGQYFALIIALAAIGGAVITAYFGQPLVASSIVIATMLGIGVTAALGTMLSKR